MMNMFLLKTFSARLITLNANKFGTTIYTTQTSQFFFFFFEIFIPLSEPNL